MLMWARWKRGKWSWYSAGRRIWFCSTKHNLNVKLDFSQLPSAAAANGSACFIFRHLYVEVPKSWRCGHDCSADRAAGLEQCSGTAAAALRLLALHGRKCMCLRLIAYSVFNTVLSICIHVQDTRSTNQLNVLMSVATCGCPSREKGHPRLRVFALQGLAGPPTAVSVHTAAPLSYPPGRVFAVCSHA